MGDSENSTREDEAIARFTNSGTKPKRKRTAVPRSNGCGVPDEADHYLLARALIDAIEREDGARPVYCLGRFWRTRGALWQPQSLDGLAAEIGRRFGGLKYCRRGPDFRSIAQLVATVATEAEFFDRTPIGIAGPQNFWRVDPDTMDIVIEPLRPSHRQRMKLETEPDPDADAPLWTRLLDQAFPPGSDDDAQRDLLQVLFGAALARSLWRHRVAVLFLGPTSTSKTTLLSVLTSLFPRDLVSATSPQNWRSEYYLASLAGMALNTVGELDPDEAIPGGAFKSVVGCDVIEGRHPTHRPFSFTCTAAHFFNANRLPPTLDRSDAFFRRWRIVEFTHTIAPEVEDVEFAERIVESESGAIAAWMLEGAKRLMLNRRIPETEQHRRAIARWRSANNSALAFVLDPAACELDPSAKTDGIAVFQRYREWAQQIGVRAFGRNNFYEALTEGAGRIGIGRMDTAFGIVLRGLRLRS